MQNPLVQLVEAVEGLALAEILASFLPKGRCTNIQGRRRYSSSFRYACDGSL